MGTDFKSVPIILIAAHLALLPIINGLLTSSVFFMLIVDTREFEGFKRYSTVDNTKAVCRVD
jgi:hypothetical protein